MALIITPGQLARRAEFYHQLNQLTGAGLGLLQSLEQLQRHPPSPSYREPIRKMIEGITQGYTFTESLERLGTWLPSFDLALIHAGEQSGRLESCMRLLANYYDDRARVARQVLADLAYPIALFHLAVFIFPFSQLFITGNLRAYLYSTFGVLLPFYGLVAFVVFATQSRHGEHWRAWIERLLHPVPVLGTAWLYLALSRLAASLEALISAGVTIFEAWELAATASGSPALRKTVIAWRPAVKAGQTPGEVVNDAPIFPQMFANQYKTGEVSGKLDDTLRRLANYYQQEGQRKLHAVAQWSPRAVYLLVALMIGYRVVTFWTGYFQQIQNAAGF